MKAVSLFSGGLDSVLSTYMIKEQGIEILGLNFLHPFYSNKKDIENIAKRIDIELKKIDISGEFLDILKKPNYGYGSEINPCIDCRIMMLKKAKEIMKNSGASFIITGEILGQRPMSQYKQNLRLIEKKSELDGLILRPLSAKLLPETIPEKNGWVDRSKLLDLSGRTRRPQLALASELGIKDYFTPGTGCLLTDPGFARRMRDLLRYNPDFDLEDVQLLKLGRHFRVSKDVKLIVGRNKEENDSLLSLAREDDFIFFPKDKKGPLSLGRGVFKDKSLINLCASIVAYYCDKRKDVKITYTSFKEKNDLEVKAFPPEKIESLRIN